MTPAWVRCKSCGVEIALDDDPAVMLAEVETFCAAHDEHGVGIEIELGIEITDEAG